MDNNLLIPSQHLEEEQSVTFWRFDNFGDVNVERKLWCSDKELKTKPLSLDEIRRGIGKILHYAILREQDFFYIAGMELGGTSKVNAVYPKEFRNSFRR